MDGTIITSLTSVFTSVGSWLITFINSVVTLFYTDGSLTLLGTLAVMALAISIFLMIVNVVSRFLHFRG